MVKTEEVAPIAPDEGGTNNANAKIGDGVHCYCKSSCNAGISSSAIDGSPQSPNYFPQQSPSNKARCQTFCEQWSQSNVGLWAEQNKFCGDLRCHVTSQVGTGPTAYLTDVVANTTGKPWCNSSGGGTGGGNGCCPPLDKATMQGLFDQYSHQMNNGYQIYFNASAASTFVNSYAAYINYVKFLCKDAAAVKITFTLYNNTTLGGTLSSVFGTPFSITINPNGTTTPAIPTGALFGVTVPVSSAAYGIKATTEFVDARGNKAQCAALSDACTADNRFTWIYNVGGRTSNPNANVGN